MKILSALFLWIPGLKPEQPLIRLILSLDHPRDAGQTGSLLQSVMSK